jgi:hypothetical protein
MSDPNEQPSNEPAPEPALPPNFLRLFGPARTPFQRACERLAIEQAIFERQAARAAEGEDPQFGWALFAFRCGRADMPRGFLPF